MRTSTLPALALVVALAAAACGGAGDPSGSGTTPTGPTPATSPADTGGAPSPTAASELGVVVAGYDIAVDDDARLIVGVFMPDQRPVGGGEVAMDFTYLGEDGSGEGEAGPSTTGTFLPVPGKEPPANPSAPTPLDEGVGVYQTRVALEQPGVWTVAVTAEVDGESRSSAGAFQVRPEHQVPAVGDPAPATDTLTMESGAAPGAIDSRATTGDGEIPDPELHQTSVAGALEAGRPFVVIFSTPVFCVSQFCGPITDTVQDLAGTYGDRAEFIHVEVWGDFQNQELNPGVREWIGTSEPWVYLVGADGTVAGRWDNVLDADELTAMLEELPAG